MRFPTRSSSALMLLVTLALLTSFAPPKGSYQLKTVVIDAGHGGKDPGCSGISTKEKDVALAVALKLGKYIEQNCSGVKVIYTRTTDVFVELQERAGIANRNNADLFICIHCNANPNKDAHGAETYVMGLHKTKGNLEVAKRENSAILLEDNYKKNYAGFDPNSDEANILFSMYQNVHQQQSIDLATKIQYYYRDKAMRTDKGVKQAGFLVLWKTTMPSLLTETGFLTNPEEEKYLSSTSGQDFLAFSIFKAFRDYKDQVEGNRHQTYNDSAVLKTTKVQAAETPVAPAPVKKDSPIVKILPQVPVVQADTTPYLAVQIIVADKPLPKGASQFKGASPITELKEQSIYKYAVGKITSIDEAINTQTEMRKKGFKDAFVIGVLKGHKIPFAEAKKLLKLKD